MGKTQRDRTRRWLATPRGKYSLHKHNARMRGVEFTLTFDEWWSIWQKSGQWKRRGNRSGHYVMCRIMDEGPYAVGNVFIGTFNLNVCDRNRSVARKRHTAKTTTVIFSDEPPF